MHHEEKIKELLKTAKNPLVLAVGGGNDSVSTLLLQKQLQHTFSYQPSKINVVAMLPDCLVYENLIPKEHHLVGIINENTQRYVQSKLMTAFPERILSINKDIIPSLKIESVYGLSMQEGSKGIEQALEYLLSSQKFDLILALDVGGDFIAVPENKDVLSPMMDAYMMYALKSLINKDLKIPIIFGIFGLGTDGETTPELLYKALENIDYLQGDFVEQNVLDVINFYRSTVEPNRYSRTTDFTMKEIQSIAHDNPAVFRGRFHVKTNKEEKSNVHYGIFNHTQDTYFFGKYYLFQKVDKINNPFAIECHNGVEWFLKIQNQEDKINHELNGQCYDLNTLDKQFSSNTILFFGTPSRKFNKQQHTDIAKEIVLSINNDIYHVALIYKEQKKFIDNLVCIDINNDLILIGKDAKLTKQIAHYMEKIKS